MTSRKLLTTLLFLLASWTGPVLADPAPPAPVEQVQVQVQDQAQARDRLAWQRVGAPTSLEA